MGVRGHVRAKNCQMWFYHRENRFDVSQVNTVLFLYVAGGHTNLEGTPRAATPFKHADLESCVVKLMFKLSVP